MKVEALRLLIREKLEDGRLPHERISTSWPPVDRGAYAPHVTRWLREDADLSGIEILRRVRLAGDRGSKSALYELVKRLRLGRPVNRSRNSLQK
jgi:hypothetical protein